MDILLDKYDIEERVRKLSYEIIDDIPKDDKILMICVMEGSFIFFSDLCRRLWTFNPEIDFIKVKSYDGTQSTEVELIQDVSRPVDVYDRIIIVDDILDTGKTLKWVKDHISNKTDTMIETCVFLDKPSRREVDIKADHIGFTIPDKFVIGYGLDFNGKYRSYPYLAVK